MCTVRQLGLKRSSPGVSLSPWPRLRLRVRRLASGPVAGGTLGERTTLLVLFSALFLVLVLGAGCKTAVEQAVRPVYQPAELGSAVTVVRDIMYLNGPEADIDKHRLNLYLPQGSTVGERGSIPVLVFVHGGSLRRGDKDLEFAGFDFYGNIGRYYSARGIVVAVVNYRLQPEVGWREQVEDVAAAASWVRRSIVEKERLGGTGRVPRLYLSGHSAGAWLVARVALDPEVRGRFGLGGNAIAGVISISGSGFELTDRRTWELYSKEDWWAERFAVPPPGDWHEVASVVPLVATCDCAGPARDGASKLSFLLLYSNQDLPALARQNRLLAEALDASDVEYRMVAVSSESHRRTMLAMSHPEKIVAREVLSYIHTHRLDLSSARQEEVMEELGIH